MNDVTPTRDRILTAASAEFARFGIAGARVDRIAATARANKSQMYEYFGSKDALFDAVCRAHLARLVERVPLTGDLVLLATSLYDEYLADPDLVRLSMWMRLERAPTGYLFSGLQEYDPAKLRSIAEAQERGVIDPALEPADVLSLVTALALAWSPVSTFVAASPGDTEAEHARRRSALAEVVRRGFAP